MSRQLHKRHGQAGFTIVELMVATLVFSIVLTFVTVAVLQVNRVYYRGVTAANTQNVARNIMDTISQAIQFGGGVPTPIPTPGSPTPGAKYYVCVNSQQFVYWPGYQLVTGTPGLHQVRQSLVQLTAPSSCPAPGGVVVGRELLSPNMRLSNLQVTQIGTTNLYKVHITVAYGDEDELNSPTGLSPTCKSINAGNQFCSVSDISTVVEKRIN